MLSLVLDALGAYPWLAWVGAVAVVTGCYAAQDLLARALGEGR